MKTITSIKYLHTLSPGGGSGTGYSQPNKFEITYSDGHSECKLIDIWYLPAISVKKDFYKQLQCDNKDEAYTMYVDELVNHGLCPYTKEQLLNPKERGGTK